MLHIASYHYYMLAKTYLFQHDISLTCEHVNCLLKLHVDMLTLFKRMLTKERCQYKR
jgi:hypothetical protein